MALTTAANVKEYMNISVSTYDTFLGNLIDRVSALFNTFTGRKLEAAAYSYDPASASYDRDNAILDGNDRDAIVLPQRPINSITTLLIGGVEIDARTSVTGSGYVIYKEEGIVRLVGYIFSKGWKNIELVWNGGYATIPDDLEDAAIKQAAFWFKESGAGSNMLGVTSKTLPDGSVSYTARDLLPEVKLVLENYRNRFAL